MPSAFPALGVLAGKAAARAVAASLCVSVAGGWHWREAGWKEGVRMGGGCVYMLAYRGACLQRRIGVC